MVWKAGDGMVPWHSPRQRRSLEGTTCKQRLEAHRKRHKKHTAERRGAFVNGRNPAGYIVLVDPGSWAARLLFLDSGNFGSES